jgi:hypothetical protein
MRRIVGFPMHAKKRGLSIQLHPAAAIKVYLLETGAPGRPLTSQFGTRGSNFTFAERLYMAALLTYWARCRIKVEFRGRLVSFDFQEP